jgi:hypothetical protein
MPLAVPMFTEFTNAQQRHVPISCSKFHPNRTVTWTVRTEMYLRLEVKYMFVCLFVSPNFKDTPNSKKRFVGTLLFQIVSRLDEALRQCTKNFNCALNEAWFLPHRLSLNSPTA